MYLWSQTDRALLITNGVRTSDHKRTGYLWSQKERALMITNGVRTYDHNKRSAHLWSQKERVFMITNGWHIFVRKRSGHTKTLQAVANVTCSNRHYALMNSKQRQHWKKARQLRNLLHHYLVSVWQWSRLPNFVFALPNEQNRNCSIYLKSIHNNPAVIIPSQPVALKPFSHIKGTMALACPSA